MYLLTVPPPLASRSPRSLCEHCPRGNCVDCPVIPKPPFFAACHFEGDSYLMYVKATSPKELIGQYLTEVAKKWKPITLPRVSFVRLAPECFKPIVPVEEVCRD